MIKRQTWTARLYTEAFVLHESLNTLGLWEGDERRSLNAIFISEMGIWECWSHNLFWSNFWPFQLIIQTPSGQRGIRHSVTWLRFEWAFCGIEISVDVFSYYMPDFAPTAHIVVNQTRSTGTCLAPASLLIIIYWRGQLPGLCDPASFKWQGELNLENALCFSAASAIFL